MVQNNATVATPSVLGGNGFSVAYTGTQAGISSPAGGSGSVLTVGSQPRDKSSANRSRRAEWRLRPCRRRRPHPGTCGSPRSPGPQWCSSPRTTCGRCRAAGGLPGVSPPTSSGVGRPVLSPDARLIAFTSDAQGRADVYVMPTAGGMARRLTWLGGPPPRPGGTSPARVLGWAPDGRIVFASDARQPFRSLTMAFAISPDGDQPPAPLPYGPVRNASFGPAVPWLSAATPATRRCGSATGAGPAGSLWIDRQGNGEFEVLLRPEQLDGNLASPMWVGERIDSLSDHEGIGNLYSVLPGRDGYRPAHRPRRVLRPQRRRRRYQDRLPGGGGAVVLRAIGRPCRPPGRRGGKSADPSASLGSWTPMPIWGQFRLDHKGKRFVVDVRASCSASPPSTCPWSSTGRRQGVRYRLARFLGEGRGHSRGERRQRRRGHR